MKTGGGGVEKVGFGLRRGGGKWGGYPELLYVSNFYTFTNLNTCNQLGGKKGGNEVLYWYFIVGIKKEDIEDIFTRCLYLRLHQKSYF